MWLQETPKLWKAEPPGNLEEPLEGAESPVGDGLRAPGWGKCNAAVVLFTFAGCL